MTLAEVKSDDHWLYKSICTKMALLFLGLLAHFLLCSQYIYFFIVPYCTCYHILTVCSPHNISRNGCKFHHQSKQQFITPIQSWLQAAMVESFIFITNVIVKINTTIISLKCEEDILVLSVESEFVSEAHLPAGNLFFYTLLV